MNDALTRPLVVLWIAVSAVTMGQTARDTAEVPLAVIVNRNNPVDELSLSQLREVFMQERSHWPNGRRVTLVMRGPGQADRAAFLRAVCGMSDSDFAKNTIRAAFRGENRSGLKELHTAEGVRKFIWNVPGAIGFVRADEVDDSVKVLRVNARLPDDAGYRLRLAVAASLR